MTRLFAAHLLQKASPTFLPSGQYDPEQELWVADNQLQGMGPLVTVTGTNTTNSTRRWFSTDGGNDVGWHNDTTSDGDNDSDNP